MRNRTACSEFCPRDPNVPMGFARHLKRVPWFAGILTAVGLLLWFFPLFHVVSLDEMNATRQSATFDAAEFAERFWREQLIPELDSAAPVEQVVTAIRESPADASQKFGRTAGLGRNYYFFLQGRGTVVSIERGRIGVSLAGAGGATDIVLHTGLLFGNAARDATGLLSASDFADSQRFNDVSTQLNRIIEATVISQLKKQARLGSRIQFTGAAEVRSQRDLTPLLLVPLQASVEQP